MCLRYHAIMFPDSLSIQDVRMMMLEPAQEEEEEEEDEDEFPQGNINEGMQLYGYFRFQPVIAFFIVTLSSVGFCIN